MGLHELSTAFVCEQSKVNEFVAGGEFEDVGGSEGDVEMNVFVEVDDDDVGGEELDDEELDEEEVADVEVDDEVER